MESDVERCMMPWVHGTSTDAPSRQIPSSVAPMRERSTWAASVRLQVTRFELEADGRLELPCMGCGATLEVHQPDQEHPDRILGTCERCQGWVVADFQPESDEGVMIFLPGGDFLRDLRPRS